MNPISCFSRYSRKNNAFPKIKHTEIRSKRFLRGLGNLTFPLLQTLGFDAQAFQFCLLGKGGYVPIRYFPVF